MFPLGSTPSKRPKRRVESYRILYSHILHALSLPGHPFELPRKPPTVNKWDPTLGTPRGDKYYNQYRPQCEVCPRDHGKVVESLRGRACTAFQLLSTSLPCFVFAKSEGFGKTVHMQSLLCIRWSPMLQVSHSHVQIKMHFSTRYLFVLNQACTCLNCTLFNLQFAKLGNHKARLVVFFFSFFFNIEPFNQCSTCSARNNSVQSRTWTGLARAYLGLIATKPVIGVSVKARFKPVSSAAETR